MDLWHHSVWSITRWHQILSTDAMLCILASPAHRRSSKQKMASVESQPRFGQSVKGLLSDKVGSCSGDAIALTRQVLKGSRSQEVKRHKWFYPNITATANSFIIASEYRKRNRKHRQNSDFCIQNKSIASTPAMDSVSKDYILKIKLEVLFSSTW